MLNLNTKSERKLVRKLAGIAWERQLQKALKDLAGVIAQMDAGILSPFDANEAVHQFHDGISRKLYNFYSSSDPWWAVCRAHYDGVLTDEDFAGASDNILNGLKQFAIRFREYNSIQAEPTPQSDE